MDEPWAEGRCAPFPAPVLGDAAAPSHFPLGPPLAFQAAAFSIVNLETEKEAGGLGRPRRGNRSRSAARPSSVRCPVSPNPRPSQARSPAHHGAPPPACPPLPGCPSPRRNLGLAWRARGCGPGRKPRRLCGRKGAPAGKEAAGPAGGGVPGSPPVQDPLPLPRSPAWCQPPLRPQVNPSSPQPLRAGVLPGRRLSTDCRTRDHRHPGQTEKLSPTEGQFTA